MAFNASAASRLTVNGAGFALHYGLGLGKRNKP